MAALDSPYKETIRRFYDVGSPLYKEFFGGHIHDGYYITGFESPTEAEENLIKLLADQAEIPHGASVLDVGCGIGGSSIWLAKNLGALPVGISISSNQLEMAKTAAEEAHVNAEFHLMDAERMEFNRTFDVIWAVAVCTHLAEQQQFIRRASRFLSPGGKFVLFDWMLAPDSNGISNDNDIKSVQRGMLLQSLHTLSEYGDWLTADGYSLMYQENITPFTLKTWNDALALVRNPAVWKRTFQLSVNEGSIVYYFIRGLFAMKAAMKKKKLIAGVVIARKK